MNFYKEKITMLLHPHFVPVYVVSRGVFLCGKYPRNGMLPPIPPLQPERGICISNATGAEDEYQFTAEEQAKIDEF